MVASGDVLCGQRAGQWLSARRRVDGATQGVALVLLVRGKFDSPEAAEPVQPTAVVLMRTPYGRLLGSAGQWAALTVLKSGWLKRRALEAAEVADGLRVSRFVGVSVTQNESGARAESRLLAFRSSGGVGLDALAGDSAAAGAVAM